MACLGLDRVDTQLCVVLAMSLGTTIAFTTTHLEYLDLFVPTLCKNGRLDYCTRIEWVAPLVVAPSPTDSTWSNPISFPRTAGIRSTLHLCPPPTPYCLPPIYS